MQCPHHLRSEQSGQTEVRLAGQAHSGHGRPESGLQVPLHGGQAGHCGLPTAQAVAFHSPSGGRREGQWPPHSDQDGVAPAPPVPPPAPPCHQRGEDTGDGGGLQPSPPSHQDHCQYSREHWTLLITKSHLLSLFFTSKFVARRKY